MMNYFFLQEPRARGYQGQLGSMAGKDASMSLPVYMTLSVRYAVLPMGTSSALF